MTDPVKETRAWAALREEVGGRVCLALRDENRSKFKLQFLRARIIDALLAQTDSGLYLSLTDRIFHEAWARQ